MKEKITLREFKTRYKAGEFNAPDYYTQVRAGWYDWFCKDSSLAGRLKKLWTVIMGVTADKILDEYYVWFKNNWHGVGPLYDDVRFEPLDQSKRESLFFGVTVDDKYDDHKYTIFTARSGYKEEAGYDSVRDVWTFINREFGGAD